MGTVIDDKEQELRTPSKVKFDEKNEEEEKNEKEESPPQRQEQRGQEEGAASSRASGKSKATETSEPETTYRYDEFDTGKVDTTLLTGILRAAMQPLNEKMERLQRDNLLLQREVDAMAARKRAEDGTKGGSFDVNVAGLGEAIGKAVADAIRVEGSPTKSPDKGGGVYPLYSWMRASTHPALEGNATSVTINDGLRARPNPSIKPDVNMFYARIGPEQLLAPFLDGMTHMDFVSKRQVLIASMAALAYLQESMEEGEAMATRYMKQSLDKLADSSKDSICTRLRNVKNDFERAELEGKGAANMDTLLASLDEQFAASSIMEQDTEYDKQLEQLRVRNGYTPSAALARAQTIYMSKYPGKAAIVDRSVRSFMQKLIKAEMGAYDFMRDFKNPFTEPDFIAAPLSTWQSRFRSIENMCNAELQQAGRAGPPSGGLPSAAAKGGTRSRAAPLTDINLLLNSGGNFDLDPQLDGHNADPDMLRKITSLVMTAGGDERALGEARRTEASDTADSDFLRSIIAAVSAWGDKNKEKDRQWVEAHGVAGMPAPRDPSRKVLHIGKICRALGWPVPADCPKDPHAMVGFECPCNYKRKLSKEQFFNHPESDAFKNGTAEDRRVRPADMTEWCNRHKLGKCSVIHEELHRLARASGANIQKFLPLFTELPTGCRDCLTE